MRRKIQTSETFCLSAILALSGGFQDAYTYKLRNGVFSNAQTGNVVLMAERFMKGDFSGALHYLLPVAAFLSGVMAAEMIGAKYHDAQKIHWRQIVLLIETAALLFAGFIPEKFDFAATMLVSFACAMQVQAFRKINGFAYASTMCIGNMRSGTDSLSKYIRTKDKSYLLRAKCYFGIILIFALGAGFGAMMSPILGLKEIWISCIMLLAACAMMIKETS